MPTLSRQNTSWSTRALYGAGVAAFLAVIVLAYGGMMSNFVRWILVPFLVVSVAGAFGGVAFALTDPLRHDDGWRHTAADMLSGMVYLAIVSGTFIALLDVPRW
jgi:hypothetical protein